GAAGPARSRARRPFSSEPALTWLRATRSSTWPGPGAGTSNDSRSTRNPGRKMRRCPSIVDPSLPCTRRWWPVPPSPRPPAHRRAARSAGRAPNPVSDPAEEGIAHLRRPVEGLFDAHLALERRQHLGLGLVEPLLPVLVEAEERGLVHVLGHQAH